MEPRCVCATLRKASRAITKTFDHKLRPSGLRSTQFHILAEIRGAGEATLTELVDLLVIDQTTLTRSLALLERDGLLTKVPKRDARLKSVRLTGKGSRMLQSALPLWAAAQKEIVSKIGSAAWGVLGAELEKLTRKSSARVSLS